MERALGVQWCVDSDLFRFRITPSNRPCTRRGVLSTVSSIYDPLGFLAPFILEGKKIIQELCHEKADWDDPVSDHMQRRWNNWKAELVHLEELSITRCYKPKGFGNVVSVQLHHFSDASTRGYGQCSYLRFQNDKGCIHCAFVFGKARVTPRKPVTIPRLELSAAVVSVRVSEQLRRELCLGDIKEIFWSDSQVVLGYIANESRRFHILVANRVQQIQDKTSVEQWRYVDTKLNPADEASRGLHARNLTGSKWLNGPAFLWKDESEWPKVHDTRNIPLSKDDPELKKTVSCATGTVEREASPTGILDYFCDWHRAKRAVALCLRYLNRLANKGQDTRKLEVKSSNTLNDSKEIKLAGQPQLSVEEFQMAEIRIIRLVQTTFFEEEVKALGSTLKNDDTKLRNSTTKQKSVLKPSSPLAKLDPFVDHDGVLRDNGRLRRAKLLWDVKFPAILPKQSHVSNLVIKYFHEQVKHQGRGLTLNEMRSNGFWIIGGTSAVRSRIHHCVVCRKLRGTSNAQKMADLF